ncbi:hypothetical protein KAR91_52940 [Candidatus Pacearchaeota archaeon]|nr:hypothetical protein [Candidatus Pacearchaeota archaeon]
MNMIEIGTYEEGGIKVTMVSSDVTHAYVQAVKRLMHGIRAGADEALAELKSTHPDRVQGVIDRLEANYTLEGITMFEASFRKGFKSLSLWQN